MANARQLKVLRRGVDVWNEWVLQHDDAEVDLSAANLSQLDLRKAILEDANLTGANLSGANLREANLGLANLTGADLTGASLTDADLRGADLVGANLKKADLRKANLEEAHLTDADLREADLRGADLIGADLIGADLYEADLRAAYLEGAKLNKANLSEAGLSYALLPEAHLIGAELYYTNFMGANLSGADLELANLSFADLRGADLTGANLEGATLVHTKIDGAKVSGSSIYGVNVWDLEGEFENQKDLVVTPRTGPPLTVDDIKIAQFINLILDNKQIRGVINILTSKAVVILGRFALPERKAILDALRNKLREYNLLPIVFDFDRPIDRNITETVKTLAAISYFVIADVTRPKSTPLELRAIVPHFQIPVVPIIQEKEFPFSMIADLQSQYNGVLDPLTYHSEETLIKALKAAVIDPAIEKHHELRLIKAQERKIRHAEDFINDKGLE